MSKLKQLLKIKRDQLKLLQHKEAKKKKKP